MVLLLVALVSTAALMVALVYVLGPVAGGWRHAAKVAAVRLLVLLPLMALAALYRFRSTDVLDPLLGPLTHPVAWALVLPVLSLLGLALDLAGDPLSD